MTDWLAPHGDNLTYYDSMDTETLQGFLPQTEADLENCRRREQAVREVLVNRGVLVLETNVIPVPDVGNYLIRDGVITPLETVVKKSSNPYDPARSWMVWEKLRA